MLASVESMSVLILLNLVFAVVALAVGFVAGAWFGSTRRQSSGTGVDAELERQKQFDRERAALAMDRLRDLASAVASDVGEHSAQVGEITRDLQALDTDDVEATGAGLVDALSRIVAVNETLQDKLTKAEEQIAAQAREIRLQESEARTDSLTGLANRRAFDDEMKRRYAEATRRSMPLSLLIMDIDYFKQFNDTHGHPAGDEVLRAVGQQLVRTCREMDLPCRYGGEEFAVVMPATMVAEGTLAAERIRAAVEAMVVEFEGKELKVTASVGLAQLIATDDIARVLRRADEALYASKGAGRNCIHYHDGTQSLPIQSKSSNGSVGKQTNLPAPTAVSRLLEGLPNRTKFAEELRRRLAEANRTAQPIAVLVAELSCHDHLRNSFGAEVNNAALDAVATVLQHTLREMDLLARLSDRRFAILLPQNSAETATTVGQRAGAALRECPLQLAGHRVELELSLGVAEYTTGDTVEVLVGRAEANLAADQGLVVGNLATS